jgi:two-component system sensor histidine kinase DctS
MPYWAPEEHEATLPRTRNRWLARRPNEGVELRFQRKNGERFDALIYEAPLIDAEGRHTGWMGSVVDITERKRAEELARQQQEKLQFTARLVTMGEMASTLAHEINQPLSAISSYTTGCLNRLEAGDLPRDELREALGKLASQAQRAGRVIRRIYDFVRKQRATKRRPATSADRSTTAVGFIEGARASAACASSFARSKGMPRCAPTGDARAGAAQPDAQRHRRHAGPAGSRLKQAGGASADRIRWKSA